MIPGRPRPSSPYAGFWRRLAAWAIDELVAKTLIYLVILTFVAGLTGGLPEPASGSEFDFAAVAPRLLLSLGYDWLFWSQGISPGALVMRIRIVDAQGALPGPRRAAIRVAMVIPSAMLFFAGYAWMIFSPKNQTWHDIVAGTYVVNAPPEEARRDE